MKNAPKIIDSKKAVFNGNITIAKKMKTQIAHQEGLQNFELLLFELIKQREIESARIRGLEDKIDFEESKLKENIVNFQADYKLQEITINNEAKNLKEKYEFWRKKMVDIEEIKLLNRFEIKKLKRYISKTQSNNMTQIQKINHLHEKNINDPDLDFITQRVERYQVRKQQLIDQIIFLNESIKETRKQVNANNQTLSVKKEENQTLQNQIKELYKIVEAKHKKQHIESHKNSLSEEEYHKLIESFRNEQIIVHTNISKILTKLHIIDSQLARTYKKIKYFRAPFALKERIKLDKDDGVLFLKMNKTFGLKADNLTNNVHNLVQSIVDDVKETRNTRKRRILELIQKKKNLIVFNKNIASLLDYLHEIDKKEKKLDSRYRKEGKLIKYYNDYPNFSIYFEFTNSDLKKIRRPAEKLAEIHIQHEDQLIERLNNIKNKNEELIYQISYQRTRNKELKKQIRVQRIANDLDAYCE
ncbi:hypothetical protein TRFO_28709 [Tritrichomonas foetus]|uniref:Uncharacterized protein n=1 Tax=Tritrichomonas foetus TaxID=1144522 RepID=A0A1J4JY63_9EUKA|nr:hypothetical protein TRFO_28709 [Tritrichomonas foetus]|eukprot:OHT03931.1 hypothetical protein TRFO_28709 [Tritrichomonas foetus]